ncbi:hypothetical protein [Paenibacillus agricola]|uniref:Glyoxalase/fosfomycin resistance/dioxygenase domain-containing protein n=1 Tax=Paenibacillus agricola TaxID=2716264 RepID=A0ABX0JG31_9BACL|nr:hypothetical protein [Paenibacillus agricola]NHN32786.1 hypothetical protein [Paenibacillus agricola]
MACRTEEIAGKNIQVRLVSDLNKAQLCYRDVLGCRVDDWGHAERDDMIFILQLAASVEDINPNAATAKRTNYPTDWEGPEYGWDTFVHIGWEASISTSKKYVGKALMSQSSNCEGICNQIAI